MTFSCRVLILDRREVVQTGLSQLLAGIARVVCAATPVEAIRLAETLQPDVVILAFDRNRAESRIAYQRLRAVSPGSAIIGLLDEEDVTLVANEMLAGFDELLSITMPADALIETVRVLATGHAGNTHGLIQEFKNRTTQSEKSRFGSVSLTKRQLQVVQLVSVGMSNREIAGQLDVSVDTVKDHVQHVMRKLRFRDRTQISVWAVRQNII